MPPFLDMWRRPSAACLVGLLALTGALACRSAPEPRPETSCDPVEVLKRRPVEVIPLVCTSPPLAADALQLLRLRFEQLLLSSGAFEIVDGAERQGELIFSGVISDVGILPEGAPVRYAVDTPAEQAGWGLRLVVEVRAKVDNHLVAVVGASHLPNPVAVQSVQDDLERLLPSVHLRHGVLRVLSQGVGMLSSRFGPGATPEDPVNLDEATLVTQGRSLYAQGAFYEAEAKLRTALEKNADRADVASLLGDIYMNRSDYVKAVEHYNAAVDVEATRFRELVLLGNAYYHLLDYTRAIKVWQNALQVDPRGPIAKTVKANIRRGRDAARKAAKGRGVSGRGAGNADGSARLADDEF